MPTEPISPRPAKKKRLPLWLRWPLFATWWLLVVALCARVMLPMGVDVWLTDLLTEELNLDLTIDEIEINLLDGRVRLTGIEAQLDGEHLASIREADARLDVYEVLFGEGGTITIILRGLTGEIRVEDGGRLNLGRIGGPENTPPAVPDPEPNTPAIGTNRIYLDVIANGAQIVVHDTVTEPANPVELEIYQAAIRALRVLVVGADIGAELMDLQLLGAVGEREAPALIAAGFWLGEEDDGTYLELHAAVTGVDIRAIPQWVTPSAGSILGGNVMHASATAVARGDAIESGVIQIDVEGARTNLELRFGGPLDAPVFDMGSPVFQAFRLSYLRVVDSGSGLLSGGRWLGESLWDRTSGVVTHTVGGVSDALTELSLKKLGLGIWNGLSGIVMGSDSDDDSDREERREMWAEWAERQLEFRRLFMERRLEVAQELEPERVPYFERKLADSVWDRRVHRLVPANDRTPNGDDE